MDISNVRMKINGFYAVCERALDVPGYLPIISVKSAAIRTHLAATQMLVALAFGIIYAIGEMYSRVTGKTDKIGVQEFHEFAKESFYNAVDNQIRAIFESIPGAGIFLMFYDYQYKIKNLEKMRLSMVSNPRLHAPLFFMPQHQKALDVKA